MWISGDILRQLRANKGVGIKRLAPELGVTYTYLSKLENNEEGLPSSSSRVSLITSSTTAMNSCSQQGRFRGKFWRFSERIRKMPSNSCARGLASAVTDARRNAYLKMVEDRGEIDSRFASVTRLPVPVGYFSLMFTALDKTTGETVVLKVFHPDHRADAYRWACFQRESRLLPAFRWTARYLANGVP